MNIRKEIEERERKYLSSQACLSSESKGRMYPEDKCKIRTDFQRDRDRIIHSKAFRRLKHKTQVFVAPEGDHLRTRLTHTLEVAQIARTIARALRLNEDLVEAISLGHDLGHTPFGHTGENVLDRLHPKGFSHNKQSLRVVDLLEDSQARAGLNLTHEVRDGILNHSGTASCQTLEGNLIKISDRIAYINHDIDDAIRAKIIKLEDLPESCLKELGYGHGERINTMILDIVKTSLKTNRIEMSKKIEESTNKLRDFMFENVYLNSRAKSEEKKSEYILEELYKFYLNNPENLPEEFKKALSHEDFIIEDRICDYIAGMTDRYAVNTFEKLFMPKPWQMY